VIRQEQKGYKQYHIVAYCSTYYSHFGGELAQFCLVMMTSTRQPASDLKYEATSARNSTNKWGRANGLRIKKAEFWALPEDVQKKV